MLTCIARSKQGRDNQDSSRSKQGRDNQDSSSPVDLHRHHKHTEKHKHNSIPTKQPIKTLSSQIKDMALKASGAYRHCAPCPNHSTAAGRRELKGISSGRPVVFEEEREPKEWVAQVEPGVLITFLSLPRGGNDLKRIRFSREMFNKWQAQRWWTENSDKVIELHNVQSLSPQAFPLPSFDGSSSSSNISVESSPLFTPCREQSMHSSTPKLSSISTAKTESSISMTTTTTTSSSRERDISISNASDLETEWVEQDEPGVYITIRALPDGTRELKRVRFSRDKFGDLHAKLWWEENRARIHKEYL